jgi:hypothetical protein
MNDEKKKKNKIAKNTACHVLLLPESLEILLQNEVVNFCNTLSHSFSLLSSLLLSSFYEISVSQNFN